MPHMAKRKPKREANKPVPETIEKPTSQKTQGSAKPKRTGEPFHIWIPRELDEAFHAFLNSLQFKPTATAIGIRALEEFLERHGFWPPPLPSPADAPDETP